MISAKNYAAQSERGLIDMARRTALSGLFPNDALRIDWLARHIQRSTHFALPDNGKFLDDDLRGLKDKIIRLPYKFMTLEYYCDGSLFTDNEHLSDDSKKRIIFAMELTTDEVESRFGQSGRNCLRNFKREDPTADLFIAVFAASYLKAKDMWIPDMGGFILPTNGLKEEIVAGKKVFEGLVEPNRKTRFTGSSLILLPDVYLRNIHEHGKVLTEKFMMHDIGQEVCVVLEFLEALSCRNVSPDILEPISKKINDKRIKAGKLPIYETKCLVINTKDLVKKKAEPKGGTHASPRWHLRSGHIRHYPEYNLWIEQTSVGDVENGVIEKRYEVK